MSGNAAIDTEWGLTTKPLLRVAPLPKDDALRVGPEASWVRWLGRRIDVSRHRAPRRVLARLVEQARVAPDTTLSVGDLFEAGWPGETIRRESRVKRVHTAIWTLRKLGLTDVVQTEGRRYRISPPIELD